MFLAFLLLLIPQSANTFQTKGLQPDTTSIGRERVSINDGWRFSRTTINPDNLIYELRPDMNATSLQVLKSWILPSGNDFISDAANQHVRPAGNPGSNLSFVKEAFDDSNWATVNLPHDWAIQGPFYSSADAPVKGEMGRLPVQGVGWYRRKLSIAPSEVGRSIYLDIDGAMSYTMVWLNGNLVGGWPYGYNSFRLDLTPFLQAGDHNQLAIRLDNPTDSARWYPGGGIYRNVWLTKVDPIHVAQWGTFISSREISAESAIIDLMVQVENTGVATQVDIATNVFSLDPWNGNSLEAVASFPRTTVSVSSGQKLSVASSVTITNPRLWSPLATQQKPNMYATSCRQHNDRYLQNTIWHPLAHI
jgi:beta-galactosidase